MISDRAIIVAAAIVAGPMILSNLVPRYWVEASQAAVWRMDRWTGHVRFCSPLECKPWWGMHDVR
jgi:hypothetical protein